MPPGALPLRRRLPLRPDAATSFGVAVATGALLMRSGPRTYSITGPPPPPPLALGSRGAVPSPGAALDSTGVVKADFGGRRPRRLRRRRRRLRRASEVDALSSSAFLSPGRCLGGLGTRLRASTVIS